MSNKTHYSPADPEARISVKPGKARALNYLCSLAVDEGHGLISHIQADFADRRDSILLPSILEPLHQRLLPHDLPVREVVADTTYSNGVNYALLEARGITPWIPVFGKYKAEIEGFTYEAETDCFTCLAGKTLPFKCLDKNQNGGLGKVYRAASRDCRSCPRQPTCAPKVNKRQLIRTAYAPHYRRALARQQSRQGRRMRRLRQRTVEPVVRNLLQHYGLRRVNTRGRSSAHKTMLLTAIAFNLKKLLNHRPTRIVRLAIALSQPSCERRILLFRRRPPGRQQSLEKRRNIRSGVLQQPLHLVELNSCCSLAL